MLRPSGRAARVASILGFLLHAVAALTAWWTWSSFGRGNVLAWMDFPISLAFLHQTLSAWTLQTLGADRTQIEQLLPCDPFRRTGPTVWRIPHVMHLDGAALAAALARPIGALQHQRAFRSPCGTEQI